jgi:hypothetical protein
MSHRLHLLRTVALVSLLALVGAACAGGDDDDDEARPSPTTTATTETTTTTPPPPPPTYPLTGLPAADPASLGRPALVVKIDNADGRTKTARPQIGLVEADVVYEEMVEGSVTRLAAVFHSTDSDPVGPVRSARTTDVAVFSPLNRPLFAWSGANDDFEAIIRSANLVDVGYNAASDVYRRDGSRSAPSNLMSSTPELWSLTPGDSVPPPPLFHVRGLGEALAAGARPAASVNIVYGGGGGSAPVDYVWDPSRGVWGRNQKGTPHVDSNGAQVAPANVIIQFVDYVDTGYVDVSGAPVPEAVLVGEGVAWVLTAGHLIEARWVKPAPEAVTQYVDAAGTPIKLTPGRTWVALPPPGGATQTG